MGRVKLKIRRLENTNGRQATYAKRKNGIMKKANELSILCDIDIALLMFSPNGKLSLCSGKRSSIEEVIAKFAQVTPQERAKRKLESLEALRKTFKKLDHDVNIQDFLGRSSQGIEDLTNQARMLQTQLSEMQRRLSHWTNPQNIESTEHLEQMEDSLRESLKRIRTCKENFSKQQLMSFDTDSQFPNGIHIPLRVGVDQEFQPLSWIPNNESQSIVLPKGPNLFPQRDLDFHASSSFGSYFGNFGTDKRLQINHSSQESRVVNEPSAATSLGVEASGKHFYPLYALNSMSNTKSQPVAEISVQENSLDYHMDGSFCAPQPEFDTTGGSWTSILQPCAAAAFNEHLYSQPN